LAGASFRQRGLALWQGTPLGTRVGLLATATVAAQLILHPSLVHYGEKSRRSQVEGAYATLVRRQPQWREQLLAEAQRRIDALHVLEDATAGTSELAFAVWSET